MFKQLSQLKSILSIVSVYRQKLLSRSCEAESLPWTEEYTYMKNCQKWKLD